MNPEEHRQMLELKRENKLMLSAIEHILATQLVDVPLEAKMKIVMMWAEGALSLVENNASTSNASALP
jgi:hypothetical protein